MSILIKGIEMPRSCLDCGIAAMDEYGESYCPFTNVVCLNVGRQDNCPLVEIPEPHGDLIDRSGLLHDLASLHIGGIEAISDMNKVWGDTWDAGLHSAWRTIDDADAVIPASEEET